MTLPVATAALIAAVSAACSGVLLLRTTARASGAALLGFAAALAGSVLAWEVADAHGVGRVLLCGAWSLGFGAALVAFPHRPRDAVGIAGAAAVLVGGIVVIAGDGGENAIIVGGSTSALAIIGHLLWRYDRSTEPERVTLLWMSLAVGASGMLYGHSVFLLPQTPARVVGLLAFGLVPPCMVLAVRRPDVVDVRGLIVEAIVFEVALVAYLAVFVGATATLDLADVHERSTGLFAFVGALAATGFHPLRVGLRAVIDELLFGIRPDPLDTATRVADQIGDDPLLALTAVREAMVLPYASLVVDGQELARSGTPVAHTRRLALGLGDDTLGEVVVGLRSGDLRLSPADERVLRIVAPLLAQTLRARTLADDLRTSRGHAITAIEEERRRIRRDLHDGLGPTLSGIAFTADAARNSLHDPVAVDALLRDLRSEAASAITEIRRLVYGMRPPALDELGLVGALRQWIVPIRTDTGRKLDVDIDASRDLGPLPAAVEVAAYRIAVEALTNVARHSGADRASLRLRLADEVLTVEVSDDGAGPQTRWVPGVGLVSMRERAAAIGGTLEASPTSHGGRVRALLPLV